MLGVRLCLALGMLSPLLGLILVYRSGAEGREAISNVEARLYAWAQSDLPGTAPTGHEGALASEVASRLRPHPDRLFLGWGLCLCVLGLSVGATLWLHVSVLLPLRRGRSTSQRPGPARSLGLRWSRERNALRELIALLEEQLGQLRPIVQMFEAILADRRESGERLKGLLTELRSATARLSDVCHQSGNDALAVRHEVKRAEAASALAQGGWEAGKTAIESIRGRVAGTRALAAGLSSQVERVNEVLSRLEALAAKLETVSFNATIVAASNGGAGRGFAVLAQRLQEMASQTLADLADLRQVIGGIQQRMVSTTRSSEEGARTIETMLEGLSESSARMRTLLSALLQSSAVAQHVASSAQRQNESIWGLSEHLEKLMQTLGGSVTGRQAMVELCAQLQRIITEVETLRGKASVVAQELSHARAGKTWSLTAIGLVSLLSIAVGLGALHGRRQESLTGRSALEAAIEGAAFEQVGPALDTVRLSESREVRTLWALCSLAEVLAVACALWTRRHVLRPLDRCATLTGALSGDEEESAGGAEGPLGVTHWRLLKVGAALRETKENLRRSSRDLFTTWEEVNRLMRFRQGGSDERQRQFISVKKFIAGIQDEAAKTLNGGWLATLGSHALSSVDTVDAALRSHWDKIDALRVREQEARTNAQELIILSRDLNGVSARVRQLAELSNQLAVQVILESSLETDEGSGLQLVAEEVSALAGQSKSDLAYIRQVLRQVQRLVADVSTAFGARGGAMAQNLEELSAVQRRTEDIAQIHARSTEATDKLVLSLKEQQQALLKVIQIVDSLDGAIASTGQMIRKVHGFTEVLKTSSHLFQAVSDSRAPLFTDDRG
ncbi:MAG: methyl-accepting chemotaxis protein [Myxococcaceae bacterium]